MTPEQRTLLVRAANEAAARAYAPYSRFAVGAALLAADGRIFTGCNVENASYGLTVCAERHAVAAAIAAGARLFAGLAVVVAAPQAAMPCGACRQVLAEFCDAAMPVICGAAGDPPDAWRLLTLGELLPHGFAFTAPPAENRTARRGGDRNKA